ncbi:complex I NDUFA9 subunit family protein [Sphingomonas crocodyli]|uniref:Complex I NDUFA9 subunit family protein n=1 Tax=Sphingomonas crocodyli TaxID=1979270 RepID=A0A437M568_9SPHN|nr:complex I NDUFA9 subunit family protein [Sphingomonas crocodyli]RVT92838.1 complex I NDUFA9 subunit family protein [Sphingomonas crocodyli]
MSRLVTLFGGGGFLGRYVAQELLKAGARVRVVERDPRKALAIKPLGGLGQTQFVSADITKPASVARAIAGSDSVVNLVGILSGDFKRIHVEGAANVAKAAADAGATALVHISAIGADPESASAYGRTKGEGEAAVKAAYPAATIIRPSILFGQEDDFVNRFAAMQAMPIVPVMRPTVKFQPAWVADVARAIAAAALDPATYGGQTYELGGPEQITMQGLQDFIARETGREPTFAPIPDAIGGMVATVAGLLPGAPITRDQWAMLQTDNVATGNGFAAFGIDPTPMDAVAPAWLVQFKPRGRFAPARAKPAA